MKAMYDSKAIAISTYGATELKAYFPKATTSGFTLTLILIGILFLIMQLLISEVVIIEDPIVDTPIPTVISDIKIKLPDVKPQISSIKGIDQPVSGTKSIAGDYKAVDDNLVLGKDINIATFDNQATASSTQGTGNTIFDTFQKDDITQPEVETTPASTSYEVPFTAVDVEPVVNLSKLQKSIKYPALARKANVQGQVLVNVFVGENGNVLKTKIDISDNPLLDEAALEAVMTPGIFTSAIQDNKPVPCWITIPISFRLR